MLFDTALLYKIIMTCICLGSCPPRSPWGRPPWLCAMVGGRGRLIPRWGSHRHPCTHCQQNRPIDWLVVDSQPTCYWNPAAGRGPHQVVESCFAGWAAYQLIFPSCHGPTICLLHYKENYLSFPPCRVVWRKAAPHVLRPPQTPPTRFPATLPPHPLNSARWWLQQGVKPVEFVPPTKLDSFKLLDIIKFHPNLCILLHSISSARFDPDKTFGFGPSKFSTCSRISHRRSRMCSSCSIHSACNQLRKQYGQWWCIYPDISEGKITSCGKDKWMGWGCERDRPGWTTSRPVSPRTPVPFNLKLVTFCTDHLWTQMELLERA